MIGHIERARRLGELIGDNLGLTTTTAKATSFLFFLTEM